MNLPGRDPAKAETLKGGSREIPAGPPQGREKRWKSLLGEPGGPEELRRAWESLGEPGRAWESPGEPGRAWESLGEPGRARESLGEPGRARESPGEPGRAWESLGESLLGFPLV